jgi:hypothetical protein
MTVLSSLISHDNAFYYCNYIKQYILLAVSMSILARAFSRYITEIIPQQREKVPLSAGKASARELIFISSTFPVAWPLQEDPSQQPRKTIFGMESDYRSTKN